MERHRSNLSHFHLSLLPTYPLPCPNARGRHSQAPFHVSMRPWRHLAGSVDCSNRAICNIFSYSTSSVPTLASPFFSLPVPSRPSFSASWAVVAMIGSRNLMMLGLLPPKARLQFRSNILLPMPPPSFLLPRSSIGLALSARTSSPLFCSNF